MSLAVEHLDFGYAGKAVGRQVSLSLSAGETLCLLGPNGTGKTTLFKTMLGLVPAQAGHVSVDGADLASLSPADVARKVGYVPQAQLGFFPFTVHDVVLMGRTAHIGLFATPSASDKRIAMEALATLGIVHLADEVYTRISGGERQLVLIARALVQQPSYLVMDEPTASLDFGNQLRVLDRIGRLAEQNIGVLFSTHDPDHAFLCSDRVALLHKGRLARIGPPTEAITADALRELYGVAVQIISVDDPKTGRRRQMCVPSLSASA